MVHGTHCAFVRLMVCVIPGWSVGLTKAHFIVPSTVNVAAEVSFVLIPTPLNALIKNVLGVVVSRSLYRPELSRSYQSFRIKVFLWRALEKIPIAYVFAQLAVLRIHHIIFADHRSKDPFGSLNPVDSLLHIIFTCQITLL